MTNEQRDARYKKNIKYYINWKFYREGDKTFSNHVKEEVHKRWKVEDYIDEYELYDEMMYKMGEDAYDLDIYKDVAEAYFTICEAIGIDEANEFLEYIAY